MTAAEMTEAATMAGRSVMPTWAKAFQGANVAVQLLVLLFFTVGMLTLWAAGIPPLLQVLLGMAFAAVSVLLAPIVIYRALFGRVVAGRFAQGLRLRASFEGVWHENGRSSWFTAWADVEAVAETRRTLVVVTSGIALPVAKRHLDDPAPALAQLRAWWEAAR